MVGIKAQCLVKGQRSGFTSHSTAWVIWDRTLTLLLEGVELTHR